MSSLKTFSGEEILQWRKIQLSIGGSATNLDWLLQLGGGLSPGEFSQIKLFPEKYYSLFSSLNQLSKLWRSHVKDAVPLQFLVGKCPWRDFEIEVNPSVLIPRQETELIIDIVLQKTKSSSIDKGTWVDLGTGSGVLAIALAKEFPFWVGHAVDCSQDAIFLAKKNIKNLVSDSKITLHLGHWWQPLYNCVDKVDLVVSNPPYIPKSKLLDLDPIVRNHEPHVALCGGDDGMEGCREIINGARRFLSSGGWLIFEHHFDQSDMALAMMINAGFLNVEFEKDLQGIRRFAFGRNP